LGSQKGNSPAPSRDALSRWKGPNAVPEAGRIELDNNTVGRSIRPIKLIRKNALFAGSDGGAEHSAAIAVLGRDLQAERPRSARLSDRTAPSVNFSREPTDLKTSKLRSGNGAWSGLTAPDRSLRENFGPDANTAKVAGYNVQLAICGTLMRAGPFAQVPRDGS
jgi:hypothetical protein